MVIGRATSNTYAGNMGRPARSTKPVASYRSLTGSRVDGRRIQSEALAWLEANLYETAPRLERLDFPRNLELYEEHVNTLRNNVFESFAHDLESLLSAPRYQTLPGTDRYRASISRHLSTLQTCYRTVATHHWYQALARVLKKHPNWSQRAGHLFPSD